MRLGVIGVGHLSSALLKGLLRADWATAEQIVLSPRGHSAELQRDFGFSVADSNESLVAQCDAVLLAVRPMDAVAAITGLPWRADQMLITACAGVSIPQLAPVAGDAHIVRIMPTIAAEFGASATLVFPEMPQVQNMLAVLGPCFVLDDESQFDVGTVSAAVYGWAQALMMASSEWAAANGMEADQARALLAQTFISAGITVAQTDLPMRQILSNLATPGGITEAGLQHLDSAGALQAWDTASEIVLHKLQDKG